MLVVGCRLLVVGCWLLVDGCWFWLLVVGWLLLPIIDVIADIAVIAVLAVLGLIGGIAVGSMIYGFMPTEIVASVASDDNPFAIPVAAVIGIPLYIRAEAVIPLSAALAAKGMGLGAVMALIIGSAGASLTEVILLKSIFKHQMIVAFLTVILGMAIGAGYLYYFVFS